MNVARVEGDGASRLTATVLEIPFKDAVIVPDWLAVMVPVVALKVAEEEPDGTPTEDGTLSNALLEDRLTVKPPTGAEAVRVTVQVAAEPDERLVVEHCNADKPAGGATVRVAVCELPA